MLWIPSVAMHNICIIPARGGSKRIPGKNKRAFCGRPIISYSIQAAIRSKLFSEVMVSTDDKEIASIAKEYGASVPFFRSADTADDYCGLADVALEVLDLYKKQGQNFDALCCLLPTAPFVSAEKLKHAHKKLSQEAVSCVFPVVAYSYPIQRSLRKTDDGYFLMRWPEHYSSRSQDLEATYHDAGQFYYIDTSRFLEEKKFFTSSSQCLVFDELEVQDIDTEKDWAMAELKYSLYKNG